MDDLESEKSDTEKRNKLEVSDEVIIIDRKKDDDDDQVNNDNNQGTSEEEQEEKDQTEISKIDYLESDISEPDERYQRENKLLFRMIETPTKGDDYDLVDTDNDQDTIN